MKEVPEKYVLILGFSEIIRKRSVDFPSKDSIIWFEMKLNILDELLRDKRTMDCVENLWKSSSWGDWAAIEIITRLLDSNITNYIDEEE